MRPCRHTEEIAGCGYCHLYYNVPAYAKKWNGAAISKAVRKKMCIHLGEATGKQSICAEGCMRGQTKTVYTCAKYGECTIAARGVDIPGCCNSKCELAEQVVEPS